MLQEKRGKFKSLEIFVGKIFSKIGLTPNQFTILSIFFALLAFLFVLKLKMLLVLIFYSIAIFLDFVDGAVARFKKMETKKGAFLDTICDRYVEGVILFSFLFLNLPKIILPSQIWIFLVLFGSLMTTYAKAAAKEKDLIKEELKKGFFGRGERVILIFFALLLSIFKLDWAVYPIIILAFFSNLTVIQRIILALK